MQTTTEERLRWREQARVASTQSAVAVSVNGIDYLSPRDQLRLLDDVKEMQGIISAAAHEVADVAGPLAERIRVLRTHHAEQIGRMEAAQEAVQALLREALEWLQDGDPCECCCTKVGANGQVVVKKHSGECLLCRLRLATDEQSDVANHIRAALQTDAERAGEKL